MDNELEINDSELKLNTFIAEIEDKHKEYKVVAVMGEVMGRTTLALQRKDTEIDQKILINELADAFEKLSTRGLIFISNGINDFQVRYAEENLREIIEREREMSFYLSPIGGLYEEEIKLIKKGFDAQKRQFYFSETTKEKQNLTESLKIQNKKIFKKARSLIPNRTKSQWITN